jgi:hypothetical protein
VRTRVTAAAAAALAFLGWLGLLAALGGPAGAAQVAAPLRISSEITDDSGALTGHRAEVQAAINHLYDNDRLKLYVVYVRIFSGLSPTAWVDQTAVRSGLTGPRLRSARPTVTARP